MSDHPPPPGRPPVPPPALAVPFRQRPVALSSFAAAREHPITERLPQRAFLADPVASPSTLEQAAPLVCAAYWTLLRAGPFYQSGVGPLAHPERRTTPLADCLPFDGLPDEWTRYDTQSSPSETGGVHVYLPPLASELSLRSLMSNDEYEDLHTTPGWLGITNLDGQKAEDRTHRARMHLPSLETMLRFELQLLDDMQTAAGRGQSPYQTISAVMARWNLPYRFVAWVYNILRPAATDRHLSVTKADILAGTMQDLNDATLNGDIRARIAARTAAAKVAGHLVERKEVHTTHDNLEVLRRIAQISPEATQEPRIIDLPPAPRLPES